MKRIFKKILGGILIASPFIVLVAYAFSQGQGQEMLVATCISLILVILVGCGVQLVFKD